MVTSYANVLRSGKANKPTIRNPAPFKPKALNRTPNTFKVTSAQYEAAVAAGTCHAQKASVGYARACWEDSQSFRVSERLAHELDPTATLDYIPMKYRTECKWSADGKTIEDPKRGALTWVGEDFEKPLMELALKRTKLFVCRQCVATTVYTVVTRSKEMWRKGTESIRWADDGRWWIDHEVVQTWIEDAFKEWKTKVPTSYHGTIAYLTTEEVYDLAIVKGLNKKQFLEWVDQKAWDEANNRLEDDMRRIELEEGELAEAVQEAIETNFWGEYVHV